MQTEKSEQELAIDRLRQNAYYETQEILLETTEELTDGYFEIETPENKIMLNGGMHFVTIYSGSSNFVLKLQADLVKWGDLSKRQVRAALNVLKRELHNGTIKAHSSVGQSAPIAVIKEANPIEPENPTDTSVLAPKKEASKSMLDISAIPDGRYAYMDLHGKNDFVFFMVRTLVKRTPIDRVYRYGKFRTGSEVLLPGTILVREWTADTKRLLGYQKPGEGYEGESIPELIGIMKQPKTWALVFAQFIGRCAICGKTLTDDLSRELSIGPECNKKYGERYWELFDRSAKLVAAGVSTEEDEEE